MLWNGLLPTVLTKGKNLATMSLVLALSLVPVLQSFAAHAKGSVNMALSGSATKIHRAKAAAPLDRYAKFKFEGQNRKYLVHVPPTYDGSKRLPLVLCLHGGGGDIGFARRMFKMNQKADTEGFIVAYPNGSGRLGSHILTWNAEECCGYAEAHRINDVDFIRRFLHHVESEYNVDRSRVYTVGFSNGAMMTYRLAAEMPEEFAAFAVISGSMNGKEPAPVAPISGLIIHGIADKHVPIEGGGGKLAKWGFDVHAKPLEYSVDFWVKADGCATKPHVKRAGIVERRTYTQGKEGTEVVVYTIEGHGHAWPGGNRAWLLADMPCRQLSATDECWQFFAKHSRKDVSISAIAPASVDVVGPSNN